jgi:23S rRNA-/tRNA-specific pseudouridylate synthase
VNQVPDLEARIIYQGEGLLVVNKPYDIPTSERTLEEDEY